MNQFSLKAVLACCAFGVFAISCEKENLIDPTNPVTQGPGAANEVNMQPGDEIPADLLTLGKPEAAYVDDIQVQRLMDAFRQSAVDETVECGPTKFNSAIRPYTVAFGDLEWEWYSLMAQINQLHTFIDASPQYFGATGEQTDFAAKQKLALEKFWSMPNEITLRGQHTSTLQNRDAIAAVYMQFAGLSAAQAYGNADYLIANVMNPSVAFDTTPLLSFDGFATSGNLIVIGDGIVQVLSETGLDKDIVFAGILAHEWGHQIQFDNYSNWYGGMATSPESTRLMELEADFLTGYYLTHKRGATYNWKRAQQFFELFYSIGDCSFKSDGHHGTPLQRMAASYVGFKLAEDAFPKGKILSTEELHVIFNDSLEAILDNNVGM